MTYCNSQGHDSLTSIYLYIHEMTFDMMSMKLIPITLCMSLILYRVLNCDFSYDALLAFSDKHLLYLQKNCVKIANIKILSDLTFSFLWLGSVCNHNKTEYLLIVDAIRRECWLAVRNVITKPQPIKNIVRVTIELK